MMIGFLLGLLLLLTSERAGKAGVAGAGKAGFAKVKKEKRLRPRRGDHRRRSMWKDQKLGLLLAAEEQRTKKKKGPTRTFALEEFANPFLSRVGFRVVVDSN